MSLGAAAEDGQVTANRGRDEPAAAPPPSQGVCRGPTESGREPGVTVRTEDTGWLGNSTQLGQRLGEGGAGRIQAPNDEEQSCADPRTTDEWENHDLASKRASLLAAAVSLARKRSVVEGRVIRANHTKAMVNTAPTSNSTSWPTGVS